MGGLFSISFLVAGSLASRARPVLVRIALLAVFGASPLAMVELGWAPYFEQRSPIFMADEDLGWRLRPDTSASWLGVPVRINERGMRGPLPRVPRDRPRALFLGDSVVFGFRLEDEADTLPAQLERRLRASSSGPVEVLNGGVGGWSPWQEARFLEQVGDELEPDIVLLGFVLNDVTEKLGLERFGGVDVGFQLRHSRESGLAGWLAGSAWADLLRELVARFDVGSSSRLAAQERELLSVYDLIGRPLDPEVERAWELTLPNVDRIGRWCAEREIPFLVAVFPYTIQLIAPPGEDFGAPQVRLVRHCVRAGWPVVDLREPLMRAIRDEGKTEFDLYLDAVHLSAEGHSVVAAALEEALAELGWPSQN